MKEGGHYEQDTEYNKLYKWLWLIIMM
jgi:hypothetical protein